MALTDRGRVAQALVEERAEEAVGALVSRVSAAEQARLTDAMRTIRHLLDEGQSPSRPQVRLRAPRAGDLGWVIQRNAAVYAGEFGWDVTYEGLVACIVADYASGHDPEREATWIAELRGERAGCVMCIRDDAPDTARLRLLLLVEPAARGHGIGALLVERCISFAREAGYRELVLRPMTYLPAPTGSTSGPGSGSSRRSRVTALARI